MNSEGRAFHHNEYFKDRGSYPEENPLLLEGGFFSLPASLPSIWQPIEQELELVFRRLESTLRPAIRSLLKQLMRPADYEFLFPAGMVLFSGHLFAKRESLYLPAVFMELIYLGTMFNNMAGHHSSKEQQMYVLTGDYLYSHLFRLLYESESLFLLEKFSALVTTMNEGLSSEERYRLEKAELGIKEVEELLHKQYGFFYGESCALGGLFAGSTAYKQLLLREFGTAFGIAYGVHKKGYSLLPAHEILEKGLRKLSLLPESQGRSELEAYARGAISNSES